MSRGRVIEWVIYQAQCECGWMGDECVTREEARDDLVEHQELEHVKVVGE